jgi:hypothetical protein
MGLYSSYPSFELINTVVILCSSCVMSCPAVVSLTQCFSAWGRKKGLTCLSLYSEDHNNNNDDNNSNYNKTTTTTEGVGIVVMLYIVFGGA